MKPASSEGGRPRASDARTPMMKQYLAFKESHPEAVLFFRMGDFYEMFFEDAEIVARTLGLTQTRRGKGPGSYPMAGIPYHALDRYLPRMIEQGFKVAICEQVEDPKTVKGKTIVRREIVDVVTPGTLTDERYLSPGAPCYLLMVTRQRARLGLSWIDLSTGRFFVTELPAHEAALQAEIQRIQPRELLLSDKVLQAMGRHTPRREAVIRSDAELGHAVEAARGEVMLSAVPDWSVDRESALRRLRERFGVASLEGFGLDEASPEVAAAGGLLFYAERMKAGQLGALRPPRRTSRESIVRLDGATLRCLELVSAMRGQAEGTLLSALDRTVTSMGARCLRSWLLAPLLDRAEIERRLDRVSVLREDPLALSALRGSLEGVFDLERLAQRLASGRAGPRDLGRLRDSLERLPEVRASCARAIAGATRSPEALEAQLSRLGDHTGLTADLAATLVAQPAQAPSEGAVIREGISSELDELRGLTEHGQASLERYQEAEAERTGIPSLKIGYNRVFGYYLEVTNANRHLVPADYVRKQTLKNAERYLTQDLKEYEERLLTARDRAIELETRLFEELRARAGGSVRALQESADVIAELDVLGTFAEVATQRSYVRPVLRDDERIEIRGGRHPVLDALGGDEPFVPNDFVLGDEESGRVAILTGPNMAGKSTYIRQVALIVLMAQIGSEVPAELAEVGLCDRIFTRIGSADDLTRGLSTFMVEMVETSNILNNATAKSLVVLDEVGRGTSTYDGVSIAWAMTEYLYDRIGARTLFATHYHELTGLSSQRAGVRNYSVAVREWQDEIIFLRKIVAGGADKSYGIQVARLAGVPGKVIDRARVILDELEQGSFDLQGRPLLIRSSAELESSATRQLSLFETPPDPLRERLDELDIDRLSPIDALLALKQLQELAKES